MLADRKTTSGAYRLKHYDLSITKHTGPSGVLAVKLTDAFENADLWSFGSDWVVLFSNYKRKKILKKLELKPLFAPMCFENYSFAKVCFARFSDSNLLHITTACGHLVTINMLNPAVEAVVRIHESAITSMKLISNERILTTGIDGTLVVYSATEKVAKLVVDLKLPLLSFDFSADRKQIIFASMTNVLMIYNVVDDFKVSKANKRVLSQSICSQFLECA